MRKALLGALLLLSACDARRLREEPLERARLQQATDSLRAIPAMPPTREGVTLAAAAPRAQAAPSSVARNISRTSLATPMLIRSGEVTLRVDTLAHALRKLQAIADTVGALMVSSSTNAGSADRQDAQVLLKVAPDEFDRMIEALGRLGTVEAREVSTQDVGEEFVDVEAQLSNGRRLEARLLRLLDTRTGRLSDVVDIERELARVRRDVDVLEGRRRYLQSRVALSNLAVRLYEAGPVIGGTRPGVLRLAGQQAWENFVWFIALLIQSLGVIVPLGVLAFVAVTLIRRTSAFRRTRPASALVT